jgi:pyruvate formate lyase activating enzyme
MTNLPPTPIKTLRDARNIARDAGVHYVYTGNLPGDEGENTYCSNCSNLLINRYGYKIIANNLSGSSCPGCGKILEGVF